MIRTFAEIRAKVKRGEAIKSAAKLDGDETAYKAIAATSNADVKTAIETFRKHKLERLAESVTTHTTVEQYAQLDNLRQRESVSVEELQMFAEGMRDNYGAMQSLREIADKHGYRLYVQSSDDITRRINAACDYALQMIERGNDGSYAAHAFFGNYEDKTEWKSLTDGLDGDAFSAIPLLEGKKKRTLQDNEAALLEKLFLGVSPTALAYEINSAAQSPEIRTLIELSPDYSALLLPPEEFSTVTRNEIQLSDKYTLVEKGKYSTEKVKAYGQ